MDSPVKKPNASEMARCAPPYTKRAGEEPWEGAFLNEGFLRHAFIKAHLDAKKREEAVPKSLIRVCLT